MDTVGRKSDKAKGRISFARYEKVVSGFFKVSFDLMIGGILDRQTNAMIDANWIFKNSRIGLLGGKTIAERLRVRIINTDALFVMKMISCRPTDIRDIFMMATAVKDRRWIRTEVSSRYDFADRLAIVKGAVTSKKFRDGLQGVYGMIDDQTFERSINAIELLNSDK